LYDYLCAEETEWTDERDAEGLADCAFGVIVFSEQRFISGVLDQLFLFPVQEDRSVCFLQEEEAGDLDECVCDGCGVEYPATKQVSTYFLSEAGKGETYRQVVFSVMKPPATGPTAGPRRGARL
jgi:hypothetical protein